MNSKKSFFSIAAAVLVTMLPALAQNTTAELAARARTPAPAAPSAVGSWFGIARPCPAKVETDSPTHVAFCQAVCGECSFIPNTLPPEVPMMPTLFADGTVIADDAGEIARYHTTATGFWTASANDGLPDFPGKVRARATFFWLGSTAKHPDDPNDSGTCCFSNSVRPRFVTYFDPNDPDRMDGFIQPYAAPFVDANTGLVIVNPFSPSDPKAGNHVPATGLDLIGGPLPAGCQNNLGCLGTYHFVIRRIKSL